MRDTFVRTLIEEAMQNARIELITGDLGFGVLKPYWETCPDQFTNAGIAEQNMTSVAAGMALSGKIVFTYSIGNFPTLRCIEQIRNDCAYHDANVKIVCVGGGFVYGALGMSHHATEDIAMMRALPGVTVVCPGDPMEAKAATKAIVHMPGTAYLRLGRGGERQVYNYIPDFVPGKAVKIRAADVQGKKRVAVLSTGAILEDACKACTILENEGYAIDQYSMPWVKPIDTDVILACAQTADLVVTVEEHNIVGGLGGAVSEVMASQSGDCRARLVRIGIEDTYCAEVGDQRYLRAQYKIDTAHIVEAVRVSAAE